MAAPNPLPADLTKQLSDFLKEAQAITQEYVDVVEQNPVPATIYHYTDGAALKAILETGKLWFTDIFYLNDPSELQHGVAHADKALFASSALDKAEEREFFQLFRRTKLGVDSAAHYFVCSFSEASDDLPQWRAYADQGRGFVLGFDGPKLEAAFSKEGGEKALPERQSFRISYDEAKLAEMQERVVQKAIPLVSAIDIQRLSEEQRENYRMELAAMLTTVATIIALMFKHPAYKNEAEYRFMLLQAVRLPFKEAKYRHRTRPDTLIRYWEFDWKKLAPDAFKEVVIGPAADMRLAERFVRDCRRAYHEPVGTFKLTRSAIPFRVPYQ